MKIKKGDICDEIEKIYLNNRIIISFIISIIITMLYFFGFIDNIRSNIPNLVALSAAILVVITLILTILLYLNDKDSYRAVIVKHDMGKHEIFMFTFKIIVTNIVSVMVLIAIGVLKIELLWFKIIIALIGSYFFFYMILGAMYMLWFAIYIVTKVSEEKPAKVK